PVILPTPAYFNILDFKEGLIAENDERPLTPKFLRHEVDWEVLNYFFDLMETLCQQPVLQDQFPVRAKAPGKHGFDKSIPALGNQTPRQAVKTEKGCERLEALLIHYERYDRDRGRSYENPFKADIAYLKSVLAVN